MQFLIPKNEKYKTNEQLSSSHHHTTPTIQANAIEQKFNFYSHISIFCVRIVFFCLRLAPPTLSQQRMGVSKHMHKWNLMAKVCSQHFLSVLFSFFSRLVFKFALSVYHFCRIHWRASSFCTLNAQKFFALAIVARWSRKNERKEEVMYSVRLFSHGPLFFFLYHGNLSLQ